MSNEKKQEHYQKYTPEDPVDEATRQQEQQEIRDAAKHAAQEMAAEELGDQDTGTRQQAEKEMHEAAQKVQQEQQRKRS